MFKVKLFIGSSKASLGVARLVRDRLARDGTVEVRLWDEGIFSLNRGFLEELLSIRSEFDFVVLIWAPDDVTESMGESKASPRDNVVFECGLFMGALGRERVFIICDKSVSMKIPSDLAGITLATYDGQSIASGNLEGAVQSACDRISLEIQRPRFPTIVGDWKSRYALDAEPGHAEVIDVVEVKASRGGVYIESKNNPKRDYYTAYGRIVREHLILGEWSRLGNSDAGGAFILTVNPSGTVMYGYCSGLNEHGATVYATWVLAKHEKGVDSRKIKERLRLGEQSLNETTIKLPPGPPD